MTECELDVRDTSEQTRNTLITRECLSTLDDVSQMVQSLTGDMRGRQADDVLPAVELTLAEVLTNVVEHSYEMKSDGRIRIKMYVGADWLWFWILDTGCAMPSSMLPGSSMPDLEQPFEDLPEGGFGWPLIRELADKVSHRRKCGVNRLSLAFRISTVSV